MTNYIVTYYCNDDVTTGYTSVVRNSGGNTTGAAGHVFKTLPPLPKDIVGVIVTRQYLH